MILKPQQDKKKKGKRKGRGRKSSSWPPGSWPTLWFPQHTTSRCRQHAYHSFERKLDEVVQQQWPNPSGEVSAANRETLVGHLDLHYLMILPATLEPVHIPLSKEPDTRAQRLESLVPSPSAAGRQS